MRINNTASVSLLNGSEENVGKVARSIVHAFDLNEISAPGCEQPVMSRGRKLCTLLELTLPFLSLSRSLHERIYIRKDTFVESRKRFVRFRCEIGQRKDSTDSIYASTYEIIEAIPRMTSSAFDVVFLFSTFTQVVNAFPSLFLL